MTWLRIVSWHKFDLMEPSGIIYTKCGRRIRSSAALPRRDIFPADERSCETCLRLVERDGLRAAPSPADR